jgi:predicted flap endonuclease-1-like 5' DNA nuclease
LLVLLGFAAGCALGLFFGWLLHRERVERALYEDVVRTRDRATTTLAETSARLELANKDMVRLRGQLTNAQHLLAERDATISELEDELAALGADHVRDEPSADEPIDVAADAATTPDEVRLFDDADLDEADITEEVPLPAVDAAGGTADEGDEPAPDAVAVDEDAGPPAVAEPAAVTDEEPAEVAAEPHPGAEAFPDSEPSAGAEPEPAVPAPAEDATTVAPTQAEDVEEPAEDAEIGVPLVLEAEALSPEPGVTADDLKRISGVGPAIERQLRAEGIRTYRQLALLDDPAIAALEARSPRLVTRLRRGGWVAQARRLHVESYGTPP